MKAKNMKEMINRLQKWIKHEASGGVHATLAGVALACK